MEKQLFFPIMFESQDHGKMVMCTRNKQVLMAQ